MVERSDSLLAFAICGIGTIEAGDNLAEIVSDALAADIRGVHGGDVVVITSKLLSRAEGRFVRLSDVVPSARAAELAAQVGKDERLVELVLRDSVDVSRVASGVLITRHRLGFICANAGIDASNARPRGANHHELWVLTMPIDPDASARALRASLQARFRVDLAVMITDSIGRPFRHGTVGLCIGLAGFDPVEDRRGEVDRFGRVLEATYPAVADAIAATADLVAGQGDEGTPVVVVRGFRPRAGTFNDRDATALVRLRDEDLYA